MKRINPTAAEIANSPAAKLAAKLARSPAAKMMNSQMAKVAPQIINPEIAKAATRISRIAQPYAEALQKFSHIEWIGKIPAHWEVTKLKTNFAYEKGKNAALYTKEYAGLHKGSYPVYSGQTEDNGIMGTIDTFDYDLEECVFSTTVGAKVMTPMYLSGKFSLSQNCLIMKPIGTYLCKMLYYCLEPLFDYERKLIPSYMQPSLRFSDLNKYCLPQPPISEQQAIADYLERECARIDTIIEKRERMIELMTEYKKSLIYECVTGKKEIVDVVE